ncbi:exported hypothetical protein [Agrobacterium genomosp. 2 str. CFBP 5494]|uniref:Thermonuclease family protein n=5 Tax=Hyphomicrobiales TaxID=356 RepID=A0AB34DF94_9HYPH|nr:thermonuclease family protein [Brucella lupini]QCM13824.1 thermonuclease family protein [Agrobacterium tumefaciens]QIX19894.1 thermonuclease family protein [Agrobacterium pusense]CUX03879.1 exported hypothetical protein [Agrobacterium genomosp. 2 str. CFBP 5494]CZT37882.1 nuclease homologue [Rhizobium sp. 9140]
MTRNVTNAVFAVTLAMIFGTIAARGEAQTRSSDSMSATFTICGEGRRVSCVVDGDTFWFQRQKIRIADIDAPELSPPRCPYERENGEAAKQRLLSLLNQGSFSLATVDRDEDQYGRRLRLVTRAGRSIGDILIDEGLARPWGGPRQSWCERTEG